MPNFSENTTGFKLDNPMENVTGVKGKTDEMPGGVSQYSDTPNPDTKKVESKNGSPLPFFKKLFKRGKNIAKMATGGVPKHGDEAHTGGGGGGIAQAAGVAQGAVPAAGGTTVGDPIVTAAQKAGTIPAPAAEEEVA